jgi:hypothetical protein
VAFPSRIVAFEALTISSVLIVIVVVLVIVVGVGVVSAVHIGKIVLMMGYGGLYSPLYVLKIGTP